MDTLFPRPLEDTPARADGPFAVVAIEQAIDRVLDYSIPKKLAKEIQIGQRVRVPLGRGNKLASGYIVDMRPTTEHEKIKPLEQLLDERVLVSPKMMTLARWMSKYYVAPLGIVLDSIIPSAVKKRIGIGYTSIVRWAIERHSLQSFFEKTKAPKRRAILARLLQLKPDEGIEIVRLAGEAEVKPASIRKLARLGIITITRQPDLAGLTEDEFVVDANEPARQLNPDQQKVFDDIAPRLTSHCRQAGTEGSSSARPGLNQDEFEPQRRTDAEKKNPSSIAFSASPRLCGSESSSENKQSQDINEGTDPTAEKSGPSRVPSDPAWMNASNFSVNLLHGVTGSGKTEVYLQCIRKVVDAGKQAIVLVPEIALTPQTVKRFLSRFKRVAILHSGLTATQRHRYWQRINNGEAEVIVGARSAIFAPVPNLGMIVVDEEHEASYKQDTAPRYHGRDVAIKRAQLEGVPILLGSATPSLETWYRVSREVSVVNSQSSVVSGPLSVENAKDAASPTTTDNGQRTTDKTATDKTYHLLSLPNRVRGLQMPHVELLDMRQENKFRRGVHLISQRLEHLLRTTIESKHQAILLLNRRGYSNFVYCASCNEALQCKYCDTTMTYHRTPGTQVQSARLEAGIHTGQLTCHYCLASNPLPSKCPNCEKKLSLFGLGTQRVEEELSKKFPDLKFARVDSDTMRNSRDYEALLGRFARGEIQVMLGTQMIAKGLDYPNVTLVGVISGDTALALPDFRAGERTFQLITQVAGRAGRGDSPGRVVLQTFLPDDPTIRFALKQDYLGFAAAELKTRQQVRLPPFTRMVRIILRDEEQEKLHKLSDEVAAAVNSANATLPEPIVVKGPMPCPINRIAGYYRNQIVLGSERPERLQRVLAMVRQAKALAKSDRIAVDVDPTSLL